MTRQGEGGRKRKRGFKPLLDALATLYELGIIFIKIGEVHCDSHISTDSELG